MHVLITASNSTVSTIYTFPLGIRLLDNNLVYFLLIKFMNLCLSTILWSSVCVDKLLSCTSRPQRELKPDSPPRAGRHNAISRESLLWLVLFESCKARPVWCLKGVRVQPTLRLPALVMIGVAAVLTIHSGAKSAERSAPPSLVFFFFPNSAALYAIIHFSFPHDYTVMHFLNELSEVFRGLSSSS